jgi:ribosomal-protein-alanine N-acetyltransferase
MTASRHPSGQSTNSPLLRALHQDDLDRVTILEEENSSNPWSRASFSESVSAGHICLVAVSEAKVCGYAVLAVCTPQAELLNLGVACHWRRQGIARKMLVRVVEICRENQVSEIFLEVRESNLGAIALYRGLGFMGVGQRRKYYRLRSEKSEGAAVMSLHL